MGLASEIGTGTNILMQLLAVLHSLLLHMLLHLHQFLMLFLMAIPELIHRSSSLNTAGCLLQYLDAFLLVIQYPRLHLLKHLG